MADQMIGGEYLETEERGHDVGSGARCEASRDDRIDGHVARRLELTKESTLGIGSPVVDRIGDEAGEDESGDVDVAG